MRSRVFLFFTPLGLPVRLEVLYLHRIPSFWHPSQGTPPLHLTLLWWQPSQAERRRFGFDVAGFDAGGVLAIPARLAMLDVEQDIASNKDGPRNERENGSTVWI